MSSKPAFVLVPGAWHTTECYEAVEKQLNGLGYDTVSVTLPSVGGVNKVTGFDQDVESIRNALSSPIQSYGQDVILVMHSYGGICGSEAAKGFSKAEIESTGAKGGIIRLVFLCAFVLTKGQSLWKKSGGVPRPWHIIDGDSLKVATAEKIFYNDLDLEMAKSWAQKMLPQSHR